MERQLQELASKAVTAPAPGTRAAPAASAQPAPDEDAGLQLDYQVAGELNGLVLVKHNGRVRLMSPGAFQRFAAEQKARARLALASGGAPLAAPGVAPASGTALPQVLPPVPPPPLPPAAAAGRGARAPGSGGPATLPRAAGATATPSMHAAGPTSAPK